MAKKRRQRAEKNKADDNRSRNKNANYKCFQEDDQKFYCFKRVQGRWVQCNAIAYDTESECEKAIENLF